MAGGGAEPLSQGRKEILRGSGGLLDLPLSENPYKCKIKCYVHRTPHGWKITGHRWGDVPYHVGMTTRWEDAVSWAQAHVYRGGLAWIPTPSQ